MRKHIFLAFSWAMSLIGFGHFIDYTLRAPFLVLRYAVEKASGVIAMVVPVAQWREIERMCSQAVQRSLHLYSRPAGASVLNSPLLS